jgi:eukaryotic-like serine/threonine-protein kinase
MWKPRIIVAILLLSVVTGFWHWSSKKISYRKLEHLLSQQDWQGADLETTSIIGKVLMNAIDQKYFFGYSRLDIFGIDSLRVMMDDLPCQQLQEIDQLWSNYSSGKFGFTSQTKILSHLKIKININQRRRSVASSDSEKFENQLKWHSKSFSKKSLDAYPDGFLPSNNWAIYNARKPVSTGTVILMLDKFRQCPSTSL